MAKAKAKIILGNIMNIAQLQREVPFGAEDNYSIEVVPYYGRGTVDCVLTRIDGNVPKGWDTIANDLEAAWDILADDFE